MDSVVELPAKPAADSASAAPQTRAPSAHAVPDQFRHDRDRYLAFAFSAADLLVEVDRTGKIVAAIGAAQSLVGRSAASLTGTDPVDLASPSDRPLVRRLTAKLRSAGRLDPAAIYVDHPSGGRTLVLLGGCAVPSLADRAFLTVALVPIGLRPAERTRDEATCLLTQDGLLEAAKKTSLDHAGPSPRQLTLVSLDGLSSEASRLSPERAKLLMEEIGASLRVHSVAGDSAGRLEADDFGVVSAGSADPQRQQDLVRDLEDAIQAAGIDQKRVGTRIVELDLSADGMTEDEVAKSLAYAVSSFTKSHGRNFSISSLRTGLVTAVAETAAKFSHVKQVIDTQQFKLVYQPVVSLNGRQIHHYEALCRFPDGQSPFEIITFSEQVDLVQELDLTICRRAVGMLGEIEAAVAVNLSGRSVQSESFRAELGKLVLPLTQISSRLLFELTESSVVDNVEEAATFLRWLRKLGFGICLDDFGTGATAYSYLRRFDVDFVKIDGPFLKTAKRQKRDQALIRSVCRLCEELGCSVIGEMIEDEEMAEASRKLGVGYGQGWLFGRPLDSIPAPMVGRRKGTVETWGR
jgi:EAL domain-containing protein (putative c-di-GMP-specific phosphodiesterase class I)